MDGAPGVLVGTARLSLYDEKDREGGGERTMNKNELQTILGYLNVGLAIAHNTGVTVGHFGGTDFIQLAQSVNALLLNAIQPKAAVAG
jgi:hypothetical protein